MEQEFDYWLEFIFNHEVDNYKPIWYQAPGFYESLAGNEIIAIQHLIKLFNAPQKYLALYSDEQAGLGLWYLLDSSVSEYPSLMTNSKIDSELKISYLKSINKLYDDFFSKKCSHTLSHLSEPGNPLNSVCYMLWDLFQLFDLKNKDAEQNNKICLEIMKNALKINNLSCQESALHGLGHSLKIKPVEIKSIILNFIDTNKTADIRIINYAKSALCGCIL